MTDLERAGEAAWEAFDASPDAPLSYAWQSVVRAVLLALREPSEAMLKKCCYLDVVPFDGIIYRSSFDDGEIRAIWQAAIDSILSPASQGAMTETERE